VRSMPHKQSQRYCWLRIWWTIGGISIALQCRVDVQTSRRPTANFCSHDSSLLRHTHPRLLVASLPYYQLGATGIRQRKRAGACRSKAPRFAKVDGLGEALLKTDLDTRFRFDPWVVGTIATALLLVLPLLWRVYVATKARDARLQATIVARACETAASASPGDPRLLRAQREAEVALSSCQAEEQKVRSLGIFGGPVLVRLEVPDTVESAEMEDILAGRKPVKRGGITPLQNLGYVVQLGLLLTTLVLLSTDPIGDRSEAGGLGNGPYIR